jgi:hypothetical protein
MSDITKRSRRRHKGSRWTRVKRKKSERFDWKVVLNEIYTTIGKAGALSSSPYKLLKELKNRYNMKLPISQIQSWLKRKGFS